MQNASLSISDLLSAFDAQEPAQESESAASSRKSSGSKRGGRKKAGERRKSNPGSCGLLVPDPESDGFTSVFDETSDFILKPQKQSELGKSREKPAPAASEAETEIYNPLDFCAQLLSDPEDGECVCRGRCVLYGDADDAGAECAQERRESAGGLAGERDLFGISDASALERALLENIGDYLRHRCPFETLIRLVTELFRAKGLQTLMCSIDDDGAGLMAAGGSMGIGGPEICIRIMRADRRVSCAEVEMFNTRLASAGADYGVMIALGGFDLPADDPVRGDFSSVRLWDCSILVPEILRYYTSFDKDFGSGLPLKQVWVLDV